MMTRKNGYVPIPVAALPALFLLIFGCNQQPDATPSAESDPAPRTTSTQETETASRPAPLSGVSILRPSIAPPETAEPPPPPEPMTATILFAEAGTELDDAARAALDGLMQKPEMQAGGAIILRGHTDSIGGDRENLRISSARAEAVADYLVSKGVDEGRITIIALGERRPVAPDAHLDGTDNAQGRARNRRVEIEVAPVPLFRADDPPVAVVTVPAQGD
ncbi:MAG: OmpA family protein [Sphingomonadaceae bacterium]